MTSTAKWGWRILVSLSVLLFLNGVLLYVFEDTQVEQTLGLLLSAFGALAFLVALEGLRHGTRWAWTATWVVVATLAAVALHTLRGDRIDLPVFYLVLTAVALAGQLLARQR